MSKKILVAIRENNTRGLMELVAHTLHQKLSEALDAEKKAVAASLLVPRLAEVYINVGDRIRTKRMGQTSGTVVKVENGNVYFELDEPEGKFGKRVWAAPLSNVIKENKNWPGPDPHKKTPPKHAYQDSYRTKSGEPICQDCGKPGSQCDCEPHGNFVEAVKTYDVPYKTKDGKTVTRKVTVPPSNNESVNEESVSQHEVQRIYDEIGDIGETELLCGISSLRVNPQGQVISYICEGIGPGGKRKIEVDAPEKPTGRTPAPWAHEDDPKAFHNRKRSSPGHIGGKLKRKRDTDGKFSESVIYEGNWGTPVGVPPEWDTDASDLGFAPGQWPKQCSFRGAYYEARRVERREGDILWVEYKRIGGADDAPVKLRVYND